MRTVKIISREFLHEGEQYNAGGVIEMDDFAAAYATNAGQAIYTDEPITPPPSGSVDAAASAAKEKARLEAMKPSLRRKEEERLKELALAQKLAEEDAIWQREQDEKAAKASREQDEANKKAAAAAVAAANTPPPHAIPAQQGVQQQPRK